MSSQAGILSPLTPAVSAEASSASYLAQLIYQLCDGFAHVRWEVSHTFRDTANLIVAGRRAGRPVGAVLWDTASFLLDRVKLRLDINDIRGIGRQKEEVSCDAVELCESMSSVSPWKGSTVPEVAHLARRQPDLRGDLLLGVRAPNFGAVEYLVQPVEAFGELGRRLLGIALCLHVAPSPSTVLSLDQPCARAQQVTTRNFK